MNPLPPPEDLADQLMATHAAYFREHPDGELLTSCMIFGEDGEGMVVATPWGDPGERNKALMLLRLLMIEKSAVRYAMWSEAWFTTGEAAKAFQREREEADEFVSMATTPGRQECVFTLVVDAKSKRPLFRRQMIRRDKSGLVRGLTTMRDDMDYDSFSGDLATLLPERAYQ